MSLNAKWTTVTFMALTAVGAGSFLFGGCSVTNGPVTDFEGGTGNPPPPPPSDGGGDTSIGDSATNACPGNTKQTAPLVNATCQKAMETDCCAELTGCFGLDVPALQDCNVFSSCISQCKDPLADGGKPTTAEIAQCETDICNANSPKSVQDAYDTMITCATSKAGTACQ